MQTSQEQPHREPMFNVHGAVVAALVLLIAVHLALEVMPEATQEWWVIALALVPARLTGLAGQLPGGDVSTLTSFLTHMLVHGDWTHLGFNGAWLLAFGGIIARRYGGLRFLALALVTGLAGAGAFLALHWGELVPVVGASGAVAGLMGATFRFLFAVRGPEGFWRLRTMPETIPILPLGAMLRDGRALVSIAMFLGINLLAIVGFGDPGSGGGIAWEAHIGGFLAGLLAVGLVEPPRVPPASPWTDAAADASPLPEPRDGP